MHQIIRNLELIRASLQDAATAAGRDIAPTLLAASKTRPVEDILTAYEGGQRDFGENYVREAIAKITAINHDDIVWHYIGAIQSNKTRDLARHFHWVHSVDRSKIAQRLNRDREGLPPLNVCIQVNIDAEPQKAGVRPADVAALLEMIRGCDNLVARGLMAIPAPTADDAGTPSAFARLADLFQALPVAPGWDTLSMGMTNDYPDAIKSGATLVRIGTAIFGPRLPKSES